MSSSSAAASSSEGEDEQPAITKESIREAIDELLPTVELATTGVKKFRKLLKKKFGGADLSEFNGFIKKALTEAINNQASEEEEEEAGEEEEETPKKKKGGYNKPCELSAKLANFLGTEELSRPQIVKKLWDYIKENDLQNPENRKEILLDSKMRKVFECDKFTMFSMNKNRPKKRAASSSAGGGATKKRKAGTQPPYRLSDAMVAVVGKEILPRPQVVSGLWDYIKANNLQNPDNKKEILCDDKLRAVFEGHKKVTMFSMNKYISPHMIEKVDKSQYQPDDASDSE